jgi:fluoride exporter
MDLLLVAAGGAVGAACRYALLVLLAGLGYGGTVWPVLVVNVLGCALFGVLSQWALPPQTRLALLTGVLGGFTTFSSYVHDAHQAGPVWLWLGLSPMLGYGAFLLGSRLHAF